MSAFTGNFTLMANSYRNLWGLVGSKAVPKIDPIIERTRDGLPKAYIPKFLYKTPFGYPRYVDLPNIRRLAATPYVEMCIGAVIDEMSAVEWAIVPKDGVELTPGIQAQIDEVTLFYNNPNTNKESFEEIRRKYLRDILEVDAGIINKIFNIQGEMVEFVARDGATFTKNPDIFGFITDRDDLIIDSNIINSSKIPMLAEPGWITAADARERAAYFQYGWISGARPVPFGKKEIIWFERNPRTDSIYGRSPIENLASTIQTLIYSIEHNLEYFSDNSIPKGVLGLEGLDADGLIGFADQWKEQQRVKDSAGNWKRKFHQLPIVGTIPKFERLEFTNAELELLEGQKWWAKLVWACFGVTSVELGYTEDAKGLANQIVQSNIFKKRAINPLLRLEEYKHNHEMLPEFGYPDIEFKFMTFDVDEETKKASLYQLQLNAGYKSINEIRIEEGLEEVEWGEKQSAEEQMEMQSRYAPAMADPNAKQEKDEKKPEKKAIPYEDNPLILRSNERMDSDKLEESIVYLLKLNEKAIKELISKEIGKDQLIMIKSVDGIIKAIKKLITFGGLKGVSDAVIKHTFNKGWDQSERQLNKNFMVNNEAIAFIQDYTYSNIKDMTEEVGNDLRAELERGIMEGEGLGKLTARVSKVFKKGKNRAEMIARTETNRAQNQGKLQAMKSSGERYNKKWISEIDSRTSPICKRLDNQVVGMDENFKDRISQWSGPCPPSHVDCRSTVIFLLKEPVKEQEAKQLKDETRLRIKEERIRKIEQDNIELALKNKEADINTRKEALLKKLEDDSK